MRATVAALLAAMTGVACGETRERAPSFGAHAMAATMPVVPPEPTHGSDEQHGEVLDLEPVDGFPDASQGPIIRELPPPSTRRPACLGTAGCAVGADAWVETPDGFVTRWAALQVSDGRYRKEPDPAVLLASLASQMQALVGPGPVIELEPEGKLEARAAARVWLLAARVHVPAAQAARMMLSVNGQARVALNGKTVHDERGDQYLLLDHRTVAVELVAGWNAIALRLEQVSPYALKLALRLRGPSGAPLATVAWALPEAAPRGAVKVCEALAVAFEATPTAAGWHLDARVGSRGLLPWPAPKKVELRVGSGLAASGDFDADASTRSLVAELPLTPSALELLVDGATCTRAELREVPLWARFQAISGALAEVLAEPAKLGPGDAESLTYQADDVRALLAQAALGDAPRRLEGALQHLEAHVRGAASGGRPFQAPGLHVRAYRSDFDGVLQRYVVVVPKGYERAEPAPLVMLAHGLEYTPEDMMRIALAKPSGPGEALRSGAFYRWDPPEPPAGAILVAHDGYGNAGQRAPGEVDVRRVIDEMKAAYRIDPRRVSISGFSLGGSVAFWVPIHAPSVFSASAPLCGYPNILEYRSVKSARKRPWEPRLLDEEGVAPYAEGGRYLPLKMVHGAKDGPSRSELVHNRYKTLRYPSELDIPPLGHNVWDFAFEDGKLLKWLAARRRPAVAPQPVVRSGRYRWSSNYWLRIDRFEDEAQFGQLDGAFKGDRLQITTRNATAFTLLGNELGERARKPQTVVVDGRNLGEHTIASAVGGELHLSRARGQSWAVVAAVDRPAGGKRAGLEGPLGDVWYGPLIVVYGTQLPDELEANRLTAERFAMHAPWIDVRVPVLADVAASDADLVGRSVVLIGRPAVNALTRRIAPQLAEVGIRFGEGTLEMGGHRFAGPDIGLSVIQPSPWDPERYMVLHAGLGVDGTLSARYLPELAPDYLVYDSRMREVFGDRILGPREALMGGFFDANWAFEAPE